MSSTKFSPMPSKSRRRKILYIFLFVLLIIISGIGIYGIINGELAEKLSFASDQKDRIEETKSVYCSSKNCAREESIDYRQKAAESVICGESDVDADGKLTIKDFVSFARVYQKRCVDKEAVFENACGGKDSNRDGRVDFTDLRDWLVKYRSGSCASEKTCTAYYNSCGCGYICATESSLPLLHCEFLCPEQETVVPKCGFVNNSCVVIEESTATTTPTVTADPKKYVSDECEIGGCNGERCFNKGEGQGLSSICLYKPEYACYKSYSKCEKQISGECGWTSTDELKKCKDEYSDEV